MAAKHLQKVGKGQQKAVKVNQKQLEAHFATN